MRNRLVIHMLAVTIGKLCAQDDSELFPTAVGGGLTAAGPVDTAPIGQAGITVSNLNLADPDDLLEGLFSESPAPPPRADTFQLVTGISPLNPDPTVERFGSGLPIRLTNIDNQQ